MSDLEQQQQQEHDHHFVVNREGSKSEASTHHKDNNITEIVADGEYIQFGNERYRRDELVEAFGGTMNPGLGPPPKHNLANPAPLGLSGFALTTFLLSLINVQARGVTIPNIVVGLAFLRGCCTISCRYV